MTVEEIPAAVMCFDCGETHLFKGAQPDTVLDDWLCYRLVGGRIYGGLYEDPVIADAIQSRAICPACFEMNYSSCEGCNDFVLNDSMMMGNDQYWCQDCYYDRFTTCEDCQEATNIDEITYIRDCPICDYCIRDNYTACYGCDQYAHPDDGHYTDDDEFYCSYCESETYNRVVQGYSYRPALKFRWCHGDHHGFYDEYRSHRNSKAQRTQHFYGTELEVEPAPGKGANSDTLVEQAEYIHDNYGDFLYLKRDSSVPSGFEIVSHPASLEWWHRHGTKMYADILLRLRNAGFQSHNGGHCGLHIHTNKAALGRLQAMKMTEFIFSGGLKAKLKLLSRRNTSGLNTYASLRVPSTYNSDTGDYEELGPKDYAKYVGRNMLSRNRNALYFGDQTAELRLFRGTLRDDRIWASLQFFDLLIQYTKNGEPGDPNWSSFRNYVHAAPREYSDLQSYFMEKQL